MESEKIDIRVATLDDAEEILNIYAHYITKTAITFEYVVPELNQFKGRIENILRKYPYIVVLINGEIAGYAYAGAFGGRSAYDWSAETTIYLKEDIRRKGIGKKLYEVLEEICKAQNIRNLYACIAYPQTEDEYLTKNSAEYHAHLGYRLAGRFNQCGYKFGKWYDVVWMEKILGSHIEKPLPVIPFPELDKENIKRILINRSSLS